MKTKRVFKLNIRVEDIPELIRMLKDTVKDCEPQDVLMSVKLPPKK